MIFFAGFLYLFWTNSLDTAQLIKHHCEIGKLVEEVLSCTDL